MDENVVKAIGVVSAGIVAVGGGAWSVYRAYNKSNKASLQAKEGGALLDKKMTEEAAKMMELLSKQNDWLETQITNKNERFEKTLKAKDDEIDKLRKDYEELKAKIAAMEASDLGKALAENAQLKKDFTDLQEKFRKTEEDFMALMKRIVNAETKPNQPIISSD